jgi:hypothetical protein
MKTQQAAIMEWAEPRGERYADLKRIKQPTLVVLAVAIVALYFFRLAGPWRRIYIVGAVLALYLNVFVAVVQAFQKLPPLAALAPTQSEPPFLIAQLVVMAIFIVLGVVAVKRFHA